MRPRLDRFRRRSDRLLDKELEFHIAEQTAEYAASGMSHEEARRRALVDFGGLEATKEECRDRRPGAFLDAVGRDVRHALRSMARTPRFTAVCLAVLGVGIGGVTAVFTVINELAIERLPFDDPDRLVVIREEMESEAWEARRGGKWPPHVNFYRVRDALRSFEAVTAYQTASYELRAPDEPISVWAAWAGADFVETMGARMLAGRWYNHEESRSEAPVVVLAEDLWSSAFQSDPGVVGETIELADHRGTKSLTVIGVAARIPRLPRLSPVEVFVPKAAYLEREGREPTMVIGRLAEGVTVEQATAELAGLQATLFPDDNHSNGGNLIIVRSLVSDAIHTIRDGILVLMGAAICVLLIACANVASLLLARGASRRREMAIRSGLGASAGRLAAQTLAESLALAGLGGCFGAFIAWAGVRGLQAVRFSRLPELETTTPDLTVLTLLVAVCALTALLFGLIPARIAVRTVPFDALRGGGSASGVGGSDRRMRQVLVGAEVAASIVLLSGALLLIHSMIRMAAIDPGFDPANMLVLHVRPPQETPGGRHAEFYRRVEEAVRAVPGVVDAAGISYPPPQHVYAVQHYRVPGQQPATSRDEGPYANHRAVSEGYFRMMEVPFIAGGTFDRATGAGVDQVVVNRSLAEAHWPGENPVGRRIVMLGREEREAEIVGVVADVRQTALVDEPGPALYLDLPQLNYWLVRTEADPNALVVPVKAAIRGVDPTQPFRMVSTMEAELENETAEQRFYVFLLTAFAATAVLLSATGLYGVVAFAAARRTQEIGVRMALGADRGRILRLFAAEGLKPAAVGSAVGLGGALLLGHSIDSWLYEVEPTDAATLAIVMLLAAAVAWAASFLPARRAATMRPLDALRHE